jgi:hypothetical protein
MRPTSGFFSMMTLAALFFTASAWGQDNSSLANPNSNQPPLEQPSERGVNWKAIGIGAGTAASNLLYVPAKLVYGILGGITGGAGYALTGGNQQVADAIWRSSLGGDFVITPDMVSGKEPVHFIGPTSIGPANGSGMNNAPTDGRSLPSVAHLDVGADNSPSSFSGSSHKRMPTLKAPLLPDMSIQ